MPTRITIECTHCGAKLSLADSSKLGKKIKCPKCSEVFVATSDDDADDELEDVEDQIEDEEETPALQRSKAAAAGKKKAASHGGKGKKGKKSGSNLGLIIGGAVGVVVLLGGLVGVLFATGVLGGGAKVDPNQIVVNSQPGTGVFSSLLKDQTPPGPTPVPPRGPVPEVARWLPPDSEFVMHVRPADILGAPLVKDLLKSMRWDDQIDRATANLPFKPADIESIAIGVAQFEKAQQQFQQAQMAIMLGGKPPTEGLSIPAIAAVKLKKTLTSDDLLKFLTATSPEQAVQKVQHAGKEFLESSDAKTGVKGGAYIASDSIVLFGESASLKTVMEKGANSNPAPGFGFVDWTDHLTLAFAPKNRDVLKGLFTSASQQNPMMALALSPFAEGTVGFSIGVTVKGGVEAEIAVGCHDAPKTDAIAKQLTDLLSLGRGQYEKSKDQVPPWGVPLTDDLVGNLKVSGSNQVVVVSTNLPDSAKDQLVQLPAMLMAQMAVSAAMGNRSGAAQPDASSPGDAPAGFSAFEGAANVKAASAEGLPDGFELSAALQDGSDFSFDPQGKANGKSSTRKLRLSVQLEFNGPAEKCVIGAVGKLSPGEAKTAGGQSVKLSPPQSFGNDDAGRFRPIVNFADFGTISAGVGSIELDVSADETEPLASVTGTFRFLTGKKSKLIQVKDVRSQAGKDAADPALKAAGLVIKWERRKDAFGEAEVAVISVKEGFLLSEAQGIDAEGKWSFDVFAEPGPNERVQILKPGVGETKLKDGLGFQAFLYSDVKEVEVSFTFENLDLPKKKDE
jgi:phage FluMu protein Com